MFEAGFARKKPVNSTTSQRASNSRAGPCYTALESSDSYMEVKTIRPVEIRDYRQ